MKRIRTMMLCSILALIMFTFAGCKTSNASGVTSISVSSGTHTTVYREPAEGAELELDLEGLTIQQTKPNGQKITVAVAANMVSGFDSTKLDELQTITITYEGKSTTYKVLVISDEMWGNLVDAAYKQEFYNDFEADFSEEFDAYWNPIFTAEFNDQFNSIFKAEFDTRFNVEFKAAFNLIFDTEFKSEFNSRFDAKFNTAWNPIFGNAFETLRRHATNQTLDAVYNELWYEEIFEEHNALAVEHARLATVGSELLAEFNNFGGAEFKTFRATYTGTNLLGDFHTFMFNAFVAGGNSAIFEDITYTQWEELDGAVRATFGPFLELQEGVIAADNNTRAAANNVIAAASAANGEWTRVINLVQSNPAKKFWWAEWYKAEHDGLTDERIAEIEQPTLEKFYNAEIVNPIGFNNTTGRAIFAAADNKSVYQTIYETTEKYLTKAATSFIIDGVTINIPTVYSGQTRTDVFNAVHSELYDEVAADFGLNSHEDWTLNEGRWLEVYNEVASELGLNSHEDWTLNEGRWLEIYNDVAESFGLNSHDDWTQNDGRWLEIYEAVERDLLEQKEFERAQMYNNSINDETVQELFKSIGSQITENLTSKNAVELFDLVSAIS